MNPVLNSTIKPPGRPPAKDMVWIPGGTFSMGADHHYAEEAPAHSVTWAYIPGANWRHPAGAGSSIKGRENHPVVHVTDEDGAAYAQWVGKALPTEAEWEFAAWGGRANAEFAWGDELHPKGNMMANTWQGVSLGKPEDRWL